MASRTQQSNETKSIISKYKKLMDNATTETEKLAIVKVATFGILDSIQRNKISKSLIEYI